MYDERMLQFISKLAEMHTDPEVSNPKRFETLPDDEVSEGEGRPKWDLESAKNDGPWQGLYKKVGIFTEHQWNFLMCKCLSSMGERESILLRTTLKQRQRSLLQMVDLLLQVLLRTIK
jgi:proteasome activator subunit 4